MNKDEAVRLLADSREKIDALDRQLVELLNRRTLIVEDIGRAKEAAGLPIYEPTREDAVYRNVFSHNQGPLTAEALRGIYERIIDEMRSLQRIRQAKKSQGDA
ncbi:MAG TPA: chorismate mutase [Bryobacteraceae bacterium]|jgi:chorismate mutase